MPFPSRTFLWTLARMLSVVLVVHVGTPAAAQTWSAGPPPPLARSAWQPGVRMGFGPAITPGGDAADASAVLDGATLRGNTLRMAPSLRWHLHRVVALGLEAGLQSGRQQGVETGEGWRRELQFNLLALEVPLLLQVHAPTGGARPFAVLGVGPRAGLSLAGRDIRTGPVPAAPLLSLRTATAVQATFGGGVILESGPVRVPIEVRVSRLLTYPGDASGRFSEDGRYWMDSAWTAVLQVGLDLMPRAAEREARPTPPPRAPRAARRRTADSPGLAPPPPAPSQPPPPPPPDQDADGVPDALDACPLEPAEQFGSYDTAGCPAGGGIVELSCDGVFLTMPVEFLSGSAQLDPISDPVLLLLADTLNIARNVRLVLIEGHTDNRGNPQANLRLSEERAWAVLDFLVEAGVDPGRLEAVGLGDEFPIAPNTTAEGRALNRRVEFRVMVNDTCGP